MCWCVAIACLNTTQTKTLKEAINHVSRTAMLITHTDTTLTDEKLH